MKKLSFCLLLLLIINFATAQITTTNWLFQFDEFENTYEKKEGQRRNTTIKMLNVDYIEDTDNLFGTHLLNQIKNNKITIYKDAACTQPYKKDELKDCYDRLKETQFDTIISFDPETYAEEEKIVKWEKEIFPSKEIGYRVKQDWNFDQTNQKLSSTITSLTATNINNKELPYFSIKVNDSDKAVTASDFNNDKFILIQRIQYTGTFTGKGMEKYLLTDEHFKKNKVYRLDGELALEEVQQAFEESIDTVITFDPQTFDENIEIVKQEASNKSDIGNYRILQDFYFDPANMVIKNKIIAIAPLRTIKGKNNTKLVEVPMFWIVYDDAFFKRGH